MSVSSMLKRTCLLLGMVLGLCATSLGVAAAQSEAPATGVKQITTQFSGSVSPAGAVLDNKTGKIIGEIDRGGVVYNNQGSAVGSVDDNGTVRNKAGVVVAQVAKTNKLAGVAFLLEK
ncbi:MULTISPECIES: hypothetical protein [Bombella]|uniref:Uncharacterized protein n=1 Tax=Bombella pollinis TaxID=2967337 RepID=A0ABT3WMU3_9PROT|nr:MULTISPECIES: hypothetical protein [Bombella]MCX5620495.1 hypothetical protein [Bombella pollinis]MUG04622.1 hypothetical protein [Bombella sp. ESL0378]MUG90116.1 hypothetical protein [Bombella sp. ESL0385]